MNERLKKILFFIMIISIIVISVFASIKVFASSRNISTDINGIDENQYPGIKSLIQDLQRKHPNWTFKVEYTGLDWNEVINAEHQGHTTSAPSNLIPSGSNYGGLWICEICETQKYDSGLYCASKEALEYMMDPRNSVNETDLFQFMELSGYNDSDSNSVKDNLMRVKKDWVSSDCIDAMVEAGNTYKISPYFLLAKMMEEQSSTSPLYTGQGYNGSYQGFYNLYNVGATGSGKDNVIKNGLAYSAGQGWNTKRLSILGGAEVLANGYIGQGQDTLYYQKYDVIGDSKYTHQYQQNVLGAQNAGTFLKKYCPENGKYSFIIPLYKNMPKTKCPRPATNQSHTKNSFGGLMGDINGDNEVNVIDVVMLISYLNGNAQISDSRMALAKVAGNSDITVIDVVKLISYLNGNAVLPSSGEYTTGTVTSNGNINIRLSPNGTVFGSISNGTSIKVLQRASSEVGGYYWDLIVTSKGVYGYIARNYYK